MKKKNLFGTFALVAIGVIFGAVLVSGFGWVRPGLADISIGAKVPPVTDVDVNAFSKAFVEVAEKVTPSIVQITVLAENKQQVPDEFFRFFPFKDFDVPKDQIGSGSGVIISADGYILTNNHVVENANKVSVTLFDKRVMDATVVGTDPLTDLAVIKVDASNLPLAYLGNSDEIKVGTWVMAIGNPMSLASTVTAGIVSAKGRSIGILNRENPGVAIEDFIQTDAAINPGNSGGALVDLSGSVIGINTAIASQTGTYIGYGFAIPINLAKTVAKELIANGKVNRGYIGVNITEVDAATAKAVGLDKARGIMIQGLVENGAAKKADLREGDIILKVDGREVNRPNELQSYIGSKSAGTEVKLTVFRDGKQIEKSVTLKTREGNDNVEPVKDTDAKGKTKRGSSNQLTFDNIGLTVKNLSDDEKKAFKQNQGVMITDVKALSKAYEQNLGKGLMITQADRKNVETVDDLEEILNSKKGSAVLLKLVDKEGTTRFVGIEIPAK
ncbi:MAG: Do family serine endopeptidase [Bacteroidota bacterium]